MPLTAIRQPRSKLVLFLIAGFFPFDKGAGKTVASKIKKPSLLEMAFDLYAQTPQKNTILELVKES